MKRRTGIFGGSFNPIHKGHIALAENICHTGLVDELWLLVSPQNPLKQDTNLMDDLLRLDLARLAVKGHPLLKVSDFEFQLPRPSYMVNTLAKLSKRYPKREFILVIGSDNWIDFHKWHQSEDILRHYSLLIYPREGYPINVTSLPPNVTFVDQELFPISSTEIRNKLKLGKDVSAWLDKKVAQRLKETYLLGDK